MKKYLVITIDVEPDCSPNWYYADPLSFAGVSKGIGQKLQPLFNEYGLTPTYLINNVVLEDQGSIETFRQLPGKFELGTHLHPEFIAPHKEYEVYAGKKGKANSCFYPPEIEFEKIKNITLLFEKSFGYKPTVFRAGRYSAGVNTMKSLRQLGYLVDTSVTPHVCWNDSSREQPVDFTNAPEQPYFMDKENIIEEDIRGELLEVPISIARKKRNVLKEILIAGGGLRHPVRKYKPVWLRPHYSTADQMIDISRQYIAAYQQREAVILNMMFHNVEVLPGLSPYTFSEKDVQGYMGQLKKFFMFSNHEGIQSIAISDLHNVLRKS